MLRTKDIDFLVRNPKNIHKPINIDSALQEIGFEPTFDTSSVLIPFCPHSRQRKDNKNSAVVNYGTGFKLYGNSR